MTVYYFVLLPPLLARHFITAAAVGYIGALSIGALVLGAFMVSQWFHQHSSKKIVQAGGSALGQLAFGLLLAWYGVRAPFFAAITLSIGIVALTARYVKASKATAP